MLSKELNINTVKYERLGIEDKREISLKYPVIVKPVRLGSSIGVSIVKDKNELDYALDTAFEFDDEVIVEEFLKEVNEYNLAGCFTDKWEFSIIEEPQKEEFLDFDKKYLDFSRDEKISEASIDRQLKMR